MAADVAAKEPERPATSRRAFFAATGITAAASVIAATGGRMLSAARSGVAQARDTLKLPAPAKAAPAVPAGVQSTTPGVAPWLTPNNDFYRIDTALSVPEINAQDWELRIHGMVEQEVTITFQDILDAGLIESHVTLTCVSNPVGGSLAGNAKWLGMPIRDVLKMARPKAGADMVLSTSIDGFSASTPLEVLQDDRDAMLAIGMNDEPLPLEHGYPVRMVVPGLYGFVSATKWVVDLEVTRFEDKQAYWTQRDWSERGPIKTMARVDVPKSFARVAAGKVAIGGTAWAQTRGMDKVEVQIDNGPWTEAVLATEASVITWRQWSYRMGCHPRHALHQGPRHRRHRRGADRQARGSSSRRGLRLAVRRGDRGVTGLARPGTIHWHHAPEFRTPLSPSIPPSNWPSSNAAGSSSPATSARPS